MIIVRTAADPINVGKPVDNSQGNGNQFSQIVAALPHGEEGLHSEGRLTCGGDIGYHSHWDQHERN
jgi:hypothetical protein